MTEDASASLQISGLAWASHSQVNSYSDTICDQILENSSKSHIFISYIYHCYTNNITYLKIFHNITWNSMLKLLTGYYISGNTYA